MHDLSQYGDLLSWQRTETAFTGGQSSSRKTMLFDVALRDEEERRARPG